MIDYNFITCRVHTQRGLVFMDELLPGDTLYEYGTGNPHKVVQLVKLNPVQLYNLNFTDGRNLTVREDEIIFNGVNKINLYDLMYHYNFPSYPLYEFNPKEKLFERLNPDPYMLARFLIYGNYDYEYINLPLKMFKKVPETLEYKYNIEADLSSDKDGIVLFKYRNTDHYVRWEEFMKLNYVDPLHIPEKLFDTYVISRRVDSNIFPKEYINGSISDRAKMVQGIFDFGYDKDIYPYTVVITNKNKDRLNEVKKLLWSLGIPSKIEHVTRNMYKLSILGPLKDYPGFFYYINNIESMIKSSDTYHKLNFKKPHGFEMKIQYIESLINDKSIPIETRVMHRMYENASYGILLDKPKVLYVTENYLPKVSL